VFVVEDDCVVIVTQISQHADSLRGPVLRARRLDGRRRRCDAPVRGPDGGVSIRPAY